MRSVTTLLPCNDDVPTETLLKYVCRDRDLYKRKLEQLIPYTKQLELTVKNLEAREGDFVRKETLRSLNESHAQEVARLKKRYKKLYNMLKNVMDCTEEP